jgi:NADH:ubiquinone oxidoreductase subunit 4 (subunit M)
VLSPVLDAGVGGAVLLLLSVGLVVAAVFVAVLHLLRAPERRLLADVVAVVTLRRR